MGITDEFRVVFFDGSGWVPSGISQRAYDLWRAPDGRLVALTDRPDVFDISPGGKITHWRLPATDSEPDFSAIDGLVAATSERLYRLESGGVVKDIGPAPASLLPWPPRRGPVLLRSADGPLACFRSSPRKADAAQAYCVRRGPHGYEYTTDFGDLSAMHRDVDRAAPPFACGDVVVSTRKAAIQARRLSDGVMVARANTFARRGSACLPDGRALLVGKHEVGIFDVPGLHRRWRRDLKAEIRSAVVCGGKIAVLLEKESIPLMIDMPAGSPQTPLQP